MEKTEKLTLRECLIGDRAFYRHVLVVVLPIIVQNTLTNVVSLLDNVMVGRSHAAYERRCRGGPAAVRLQSGGLGQHRGRRHLRRAVLRPRRYGGRAPHLPVQAAGGACHHSGSIGLFLAAGPSLIGAYIAADTSPTDAAATLQYAEGYLRIMLVGLVPLA